MKIDNRFDTAAASGPSGTALTASSTSFRDLFELAKTNASNAGANTTSSASASKTESAYETAVRELHEYLQKTPEQRMREAILKEMGLSEDDIAKMPVEQQNAIEAAIKEKVKEKLLEHAQDNMNAGIEAQRTTPRNAVQMPFPS